MVIMGTVSDPEPKPPAQEVMTISIRFKAELVQALRELADEHSRSFNGTVVEACKRYVRQMRPRSATSPKDAPDAR